MSDDEADENIVDVTHEVYEESADDIGLSTEFEQQDSVLFDNEKDDSVEDTVIVWSVFGLLNDDDVQPTPRELRASPPALFIGNRQGDGVALVLTQKANARLLDALKDVDGAYLGKKPGEKESWMDRVDNLLAWASKHKVKGVFSGIIILMLSAAVVNGLIATITHS